MSQFQINRRSPTAKTSNPPTNRITRPTLEIGLYGPPIKMPPRIPVAKNAPTMQIIPSTATRTFVNMSVSLPEARFPQATKRDPPEQRPSRE